MPIQRLPVRDGGTITMREHQMRMTEVGRIRLGVYNPEAGNGKGAPAKLDRFRFTSADGDLIAAVAEQYGGTPGQYTPQRGNGVQWEVISDAREVLVYVPQQRIDPWLEAWRPGRCIRRCDGVWETIEGQDCACAARKVPASDVCKPTVRVQLMLADVPGIGTWRLESHGAYAAGELATLAPLIAAVPMPVPAKLMLRHESRSWVQDGERKTTTFYVPWLHISAATPGQMVLGGDALSAALGSAARAQALEAVPEQRAIEGAPTTSTTASPTTGTTAAEPVHLGDDERAVILGKIEEATTVQRLQEIAGKLVARGVKDPHVKQALKSKAASIEAALQLGGSAPGEPDAPRAERADHQQALREVAVQAAERVPDGVAHPDGTFTPDPDPDEVYPVGSQVEVGGITFTKHTAVADAFPSPGDPPPDEVVDAEVVDEQYDAEEQLSLVYVAAGPYGWNTAQTNAEIKAFCQVPKVADATGAQLHAMVRAMKARTGRYAPAGVAG